MSSLPKRSYRFVDIGANLVDPMFTGVYRGKRKHESDLEEMLQRARNQGVERILVTAGTLKEGQEAIKFCETHDPSATFLFCTIGVHPTRCLEFERKERRSVLSAIGKRQANGDMDAFEEELGFEETEEDRKFASDHIAALAELAASSKRVVAIGETGLDYERLMFCPKEVQKRHFRRQLSLASSLSLPLFLHSRNAADDFLSALKDAKVGDVASVVHSFTGSLEECHSLLHHSPKLYIGINGCSLKTEENLSVAKTVPLKRLLLETDAPWCGVRASHAGSKLISTLFPSVKKEKKVVGDGRVVKDRSEPAHIVQVAEILAALHDMSVADIATTTTENALAVFFPSPRGEEGTPLTATTAAAAASGGGGGE